jgi:hypothetical protein
MMTFAELHRKVSALVPEPGVFCLSVEAWRSGTLAWKLYVAADSRTIESTHPEDLLLRFQAAPRASTVADIDIGAREVPAP